MWINSEWAYYYCKDVEDDPEIRKYITDSYLAYLYCKDVKDRPEVAKHITEAGLVYLYFEKGAKKYTDRNWEKGITLSRMEQKCG